MKKILACVLVILLTSPYAFSAEVGKVTYVEGRVDVAKGESGLAVPLRDGDGIAVGDAIRTKVGSKAEVRFGDGSTMRLAQNSRVEVKDYELDNNKRIAATIKLDRGKVRTIIAKTANSTPFNILTPNAEGTVRGSDIFTFYQAGSSGMLVAEGNLALKSIAKPEESLSIPAGTSAFVDVAGVASGPRPYLDLEKKMHEQDTYVPPLSPKKAETAAIKGVFAKISGAVKVTLKGATTPRDANINDILGEGDQVETGDNGLVEIKFDNGCGLNLKPNTQIKITRLVVDPKTGEYQNLFESSKGKIRARVENLKGKSTFEIKTPTAICGARATIMYLNILPGVTTAFFEGGNGYLLSVISSMNKLIGSGEYSSADNNGGVTDSTRANEDDRMSFDEGWDSGNGAEGYSSPGGGPSFLGAGFADNYNPMLDKLIEMNQGSVFVDIPFSKTNPSAVNENAAASEGYKLSGLVGGENFSGTISGDWAYAEGQQWGLWRADFGGSYTSLPDGEWESDIGGSTMDGKTGQVNSYWTGIMSGGAWQDDELYGTVEGVILNENTLQGFGGDFIGIYDNGGWQALGAGLYVDLVSLISHGRIGSDPVRPGYITADIQGLTGLFNPVGEGDSNFVSIGRIDSRGSDNFIWHGSLEGRDNTGGAFRGLFAGSGGGGMLFGESISLYVDPDGLAGARKGNLLGLYLDNVDAYVLIGAFTDDVKGYVEASPDRLAESVVEGDIAGTGNGSFAGQKFINVTELYGSSLRIAGEGWGIYGVAMRGDFQKPATDSAWTLSLSGNGIGDKSIDSYWFGTVKDGAWAGNALTGTFKGFFFSAQEGVEGSNVRAGTVSGGLFGDYVEVEGESGAWQAAGVGEWVEVTDLLDQTKMFGANGIEELNRFVNVPITEVYSNILTGAGSIAGGVSVTNLSNDFLNFAFNYWENNKWVADYNGRTGGIDITGQAGGAYTIPDPAGNGNFTGVGAGINQDILNTVAVAGDYGPDGALSNVTANVTLYTNAASPGPS